MKTGPKWRPEKYFYDRFCVQLQNWSKGGEKPALADQDTAYYLLLLEDRLRRKGLNYQLELERTEEDAPSARCFAGEHYSNQWEFASVRKRVVYTKHGRILYRKKSDQTLYQMTTSADTPEEIGEKPCTCPNCGAVTRTADLVKGCPYCQARFQMSELFPKVTNFYFIRMDSQRSLKQKVSVIISAFILLTFVWMLLQRIVGGEFSLGIILHSLFAAILAGGFTGLILTGPIILLSMILFNSSRDVPFRAIFTKKQIIEFMKPLEPGFSYEYFEGQLMSLLRMVVLSNDVKNLAAFGGEARSDCFDHVIDLVYEGGMTVRKLYTDQDYIHMDLRTYMLDSYEENGRIYTRGDPIDISIERKRNQRPDPGFSIKLVRCKGCGGSFDASFRKTCPYCGRVYDMRNESWVMTRAVRVR